MSAAIHIDSGSIALESTTISNTGPQAALTNLAVVDERCKSAHGIVAKRARRMSLAQVTIERSCGLGVLGIGGTPQDDMTRSKRVYIWKSVINQNNGGIMLAREGSLRTNMDTQDKLFMEDTTILDNGLFGLYTRNMNTVVHDSTFLSNTSATFPALTGDAPALGDGLIAQGCAELEVTDSLFADHSRFGALAKDLHIVRNEGNVWAKNEGGDMTMSSADKQCSEDAGCTPVQDTAVSLETNTIEGALGDDMMNVLDELMPESQQGADD
jgi:hypothetical protein